MTVALGEVIRIAESGFASGEDLEVGTVQLRMNNVTTDGALDWSRLRRISANQRKHERFALRHNDVVFNSTNSPELVGKATLFLGFKEPVLFSNHFLRLVVDDTHAEPAFIARWLNFKWAQRVFEGLCTRWVNQASVRKDDLLELRLELPPLDEQKRIVASLDRADRLRRMRRYALELRDAFLPAVFLEMFGDEQTNLPTRAVEELAANSDNAIRTGPFGSQLLHSEFSDHGIAVLGIDNVVDNRFNWAERRFITDEKYMQLRRYTVFPGDVLISIMGTCGRCAIVPSDIPRAINTKHLCCITLDRSQCLAVYLQSAFLHHPRVRRELGMAQKGAIMNGLNMQIIKGLRIPVAPMPRQVMFAALVDRAERASAVLVESLRQAEHLFESLLHRAFTHGGAAS